MVEEKKGEKQRTSLEMRQVQNFPINYKTTPCINWTKAGMCRYGAKCLFKHGAGDNGKKSTTISKPILAAASPSRSPPSTPPAPSVVLPQATIKCPPSAEVMNFTLGEWPVRVLCQLPTWSEANASASVYGLEVPSFFSDPTV